LIKLFFSLTTRCEQYKGYRKALQSLDNNSLKSSYKNLEAALARDGKSDIDANKLYVKLLFLQDFIPEGNMGPVEILQFLKRHDCFSIMQLSHEVLLTIPVTIALAEWSFSTLKLLKSYLRSTMAQERLNDLTMVALES
jgi:hypothetical protein